MNGIEYKNVYESRAQPDYLLKGKNMFLVGVYIIAAIGFYNFGWSASESIIWPDRVARAVAKYIEKNDL